ncbi:hypothetical protein H7X46_11515 [Pseudonocardia sp. C8]|uniref:hypothetical protein n=1 Tax=Pseudonocardia sp. C8 TaxID=2762759 RepID=UPI001642B057|nr:hypothetical protein [Pseudonocardia sp. C8]MBC3191689.1 hypothetical protein [Pseudonocardia sp. C8]
MAARREARSRIRQLTEHVAETIFGGAVVEVPIPGFTVFADRRLADPMTGLRAAELLRRVLAAEVDEYARACRGVGRTWDEVGEALGVPAGQDRPVVTFEWIVDGRPPGPDEDILLAAPPSASWWRCTSCHQPVRDSGPYDADPDDSEDGHAEDCARHRSDIAAFRARVGWESR